jgi:ABC-type amino acid transport substrate-binding protein
MSTQTKQEGDFKMKKPKAKQLGKVDEVVKVDLSKPKQQEEEPIKVDLTKKEENAVQEPKPESSVLEPMDQSKEDGENTKVELQSVGEENKKEAPIIQEITEEEVQEKSEKLVDQFNDAIDVQQQTGKPLPENIEKLVSFMEETGGTVEDYVRLNADYSNINESALLREYYSKTKPYLDSEDVNLLLEDFSWDEELDDERDIRKKKLAFKEEVGKARNFLDNLKSKYYDEIKLRPGVTQEQQKAMDFFNRYNEEQAMRAKQHENFKNQTKQMFNNDFKGFDFNLGEKKFRYGLQNPSQVAETQSDINNFIGKFLDEKGNVKDTPGYHKAVYAAMNADKLASHFYEQGKADATKEIIASSKNPASSEPRKAPEAVYINGLKVKAISGQDSSKLKIKTKKFN